MKTNAYVRHQFEKGFLLKDEDFTKLLDFIKIRSAEVGASDLIRIKVYRSDSLVYESPNLESLRAEDNAASNQITRVQVLVANDSLSVNFDIDSKKDISIEIESSDRDRAYLLFSELKEYLNSEVLVFRKARSRTEHLVWTFLPMFAMIMGVTVFTLRIGSPPINENDLNLLLSSDNINDKVNYILKLTHDKAGEKSIMWLLPICLLLILIEPLLNWIKQRWFPRNIFYYGKEKRRYDTLLERRIRWIWGVVVAFAVSIVASIAVWLLTTPSS